jgi:anti-sigma factor ChrR (cupin superfamily)
LKAEDDVTLDTLAALAALDDLDDEDRLALESLRQTRPRELARRLGEFREIAGMLGTVLPPQEPPAGLRERLLARVHQERTGEAARLQLAPGISLVRAAQLPWLDMECSGIRCKPLYVDVDQRYASSLVSMQPGTTYPAHRHREVEELFMVSGDLVIAGHTLGPGDYCRSEPGSLHEPVYSLGGAVFVARSSLDDELLPPAVPEGSPPRPSPES